MSNSSTASRFVVFANRVAFIWDFLPGWLTGKPSRRFEKWTAVPNISDLIVRNGDSRMDSLGSLNAFVQAADA
jgi:hypothetical protein